MKIKTTLSMAAAVALVATPIFAQTGTSKGQQTKSVSEKSQTFVTKAANGGKLEVESSRLAVDRAKAENIKRFANKMIDDHSKANKELEAVAQKIGAKVPDKMDKAHQAKVDKLKQAKGAQFDQAYVQVQTEAHRDAVSLFSSYAKSGDNPDLQAFAAQTLPTLAAHQSEAKQLSTQGTATGTSSEGARKSK